MILLCSWNSYRSSCGRSVQMSRAYIRCLPKARSPHGPATILIMPSRKAAERCPLRLGLRSARAPFWRGWAPYWEFLLAAFMKIGSDRSLWRIQTTENSMTAYV
jgi:hypothetical protein